MTIAVRDLTCRYGAVEALSGLTFSLPAGTIYGLLGRNGSGKTTLLSTLAGFRRPSAGSVRLDGEPVFENPRAARQLCLIAESGDVGDKTDTLRDILDLAGRLRPGWDAGYAAKLADLFELPLTSKLGTLSRGKRSAFAVTVGLASRAAVTMFDEAHLGMDAPTRQAFADELLRDYLERPRTIIISTHLIEEQSPLFERVLVLHEGRLLLEEDLDELRARGVSVTGPLSLVDDFAAGLTVLGEQTLGPTKSAMIYGEFDDERRRAARAAGLELGPVAVQDLFIHLTGGTR
ncbi:ABC transporter ATP-binding protein [Cryptosporangium arvum]|uniref:ABC-type multidrug transport system, ATPase component n=1 Tax=Cryptosporangium arvum DSM 44712 TaxID=927661 RepID=A0A010YP20_9ACTN|nr:ABC transporter ATP-binding protein [Cryptosporangium arvum]EXG81925.1 ABC-type multidrug transport system, ATPase component [Cryptosporangium arvum DSM 44712]